MRQILILILVLLWCGGGVRAQETKPDPTSKFEGYLNALSKEGRFSGAVLVAREGKVIFRHGYGFANSELEVANTPETRFRIGSLTKQFTAAAILLLQEQGKLSVQDPIHRYLTDCPAPWRDVTIHHLLSHTSGIPDFTGFPEVSQTRTATVETLLTRFKDRPLDSAPGEQWRYSNFNYWLLGAILERISGESYEDFLQQHIFEPLKMMDTGYDHRDRVLKRRASGYAENCSGLYNALDGESPDPYAAGALYSTVGDLFLWNEALFGDRLLNAKSREAMMTAVKAGYAYGLSIQQVYNRKMVAHSGGVSGFASYLLRFPAENVTIVVLHNIDSAVPTPGKMARTLAALLFGEKYEEPAPLPTVSPVDPAILAAYVGDYQLTPQIVLSVRQKGRCLIAQIAGQPGVDLFAESDTKFFAKAVPVKLTFVKAAEGKVTGLIFQQGGSPLEAKKIR